MVVNRDKAKYLSFNSGSITAWDTEFALIMVKTTGTWILIFTNFVPISLLVTLEVVKFGQAIFMTWEWRLYDDEHDIPAAV